AEVRDERKRQEAVGHRAAERALGGALRIDVDPLVVLGVVGEAVDPLLVDLEPVAGADLLADRGFEVSHAVVSLHLVSRHIANNTIANNPGRYVPVPQRITQRAPSARQPPT